MGKQDIALTQVVNQTDRLTNSDYLKLRPEVLDKWLYWHRTISAAVCSVIEKDGLNSTEHLLSQPLSTVPDDLINLFNHFGL